MKPASQSVNQATNQPMRKTMSSPTSNHQKTALVEGGLVNSCQGIEGGKNWERNYSRYSPTVYKAILKVVDEVIKEALEEEISLTITE